MMHDIYIKDNVEILRDTLIERAEIINKMDVQYA